MDTELDLIASPFWVYLRATPAEGADMTNHVNYEAALAHIEELRRQAASARLATLTRQLSVTRPERTERNVRRMWTVVALHVKRGLGRRTSRDAYAGEDRRDDALAA
jgi:hypothetical protein